MSLQGVTSPLSPENTPLEHDSSLYMSQGQPPTGHTRSVIDGKPSVTIQIDKGTDWTFNGALANPSFLDMVEALQRGPTPEPRVVGTPSTNA